MKKLGTGGLVLLVAVIVAGLIPIETTVAPQWNLQVIDEDGTPYKNQLVRQECTSFTLGVNCVEAASQQRTDENGYVTFPERKIRLSLLLRAANSLINLLAYLVAQGSLGTRVSVDSSGPQGYKVIELKPDEPPPGKFVLASRPE